MTPESSSSPLPPLLQPRPGAQHQRQPRGRPLTSRRACARGKKPPSHAERNRSSNARPLAADRTNRPQTNFSLAPTPGRAPSCSRARAAAPVPQGPSKAWRSAPSARRLSPSSAASTAPGRLGGQVHSKCRRQQSSDPRPARHTLQDDTREALRAPRSRNQPTAPATPVESSCARLHESTQRRTHGRIRSRGSPARLVRGKVGRSRRTRSPRIPATRPRRRRAPRSNATYVRARPRDHVDWVQQFTSSTPAQSTKNKCRTIEHGLGLPEAAQQIRAGRSPRSAVPSRHRASAQRRPLTGFDRSHGSELTTTSTATASTRSSRPPAPALEETLHHCSFRQAYGTRSQATLTAWTAVRAVERVRARGGRGRRRRGRPRARTPRVRRPVVASLRPCRERRVCPRTRSGGQQLGDRLHPVGEDVDREERSTEQREREEDEPGHELSALEHDDDRSECDSDCRHRESGYDHHDREPQPVCFGQVSIECEPGVCQVEDRAEDREQEVEPASPSASSAAATAAR